ncbi:MAG TPA: TonB-dependent receptor [Burkholderiaceae bacterium]
MKNSSATRAGSALFKLKPTMVLAGQATAGALALAASGTVFAQGAAAAPQPAASEPTVGQSVTVVGIRKGIEAAISVKKNSDQIVEAISAEDIGKLPDTTIAESLAHLPGVTSQRDSTGKATNVNIRGLSSDFNGYLLNGREQTSTTDSRGVDLSVYPAELIAGATVYKTSDASLATAGLAGTIDNKLVDPLAFPNRVVAVSGQKGHPSVGLKPHGNETRESITYIDQFADRKIGVALGFVRVDGSSSQLGVSSWATDPKKPLQAHPVGDDSATIAGATLPFSGGMGFDSANISDKRNGLAAILEFKPNDRFRTELDIFHAQINTDTHHTTLKAPLPIDVYDATVDPTTNQVTSGTYRLGGNPNGIIDYTENVFDDDTLQSMGWRSEFKFNDAWRASLDVNHNTARRIERDIEAYAGIPTADNVSFTLPVGGQVPHLTFGTPTSYTDAKTIVVRDQSGWSGITGVPQDGYDKGPTTVDKITAVRADITHDLPENRWFSDVQFGANLSQRTKNRTAVEGLVVADTPDGTGTIPFPAGSYVVNDVGGTGASLLTFSPTADLWPGAKLQSKYNNDILSKTWNITEDVSTAYGKLDIDTEMAKVPVRGNVGLQIVHTRQQSQGFQANAAADPTLTNPAAGLSTAGTSYTDYLPSLNLVGDLGNGNTLRFGASVQTARPDMTFLRNSSSVGFNNTDGREEASGGNAYLKPYKAKALDLSYEKYFANKAYLAAAVFYKRLDTYVAQQTTITDLQGAANAVGQTALPAGYSSWVGPSTNYVNGHGGNVKGIELSASMPFNLLTRWLDGFGTALSYSNTTSSIRQPDTIGLNPTQPIPQTGTISMPGLSHINEKIELYYEKAGFSAFISDSYRSFYIGPVTNATVGGYPTLIGIGAQKWISAQVGYEFQSGWLKGLGFRLEGNNLNKPKYTEYKGDGTVNTQKETGASIDLRVSYRL